MNGDTPWLIRSLRLDDLPLYRPLRLQALRQHPEAFATSVEEEEHGDPSRLIGQPPSITVGGFVRDQLVATAGLTVPTRTKQCHRATVFGVYVAPSWRGSGLAPALLGALIQHARSTGLLALTLSVTVGNAAARHLYLRCGFTVYGVEPMSLRVATDYYDEELMVLRLG